MLFLRVLIILVFVSTGAVAQTIGLGYGRKRQSRLGIKNRNPIYVALVERNGTVRALIAGDVTEAKVGQLRPAFR